MSYQLVVLAWFITFGYSTTKSVKIVFPSFSIIESIKFAPLSFSSRFLSDHLSFCPPLVLFCRGFFFVVSFIRNILWLIAFENFSFFVMLSCLYFTFFLELHRISTDRGDRLQNVHCCLEVFAQWFLCFFFGLSRIHLELVGLCGEWVCNVGSVVVSVTLAFSGVDVSIWIFVQMISFKMF